MIIKKKNGEAVRLGSCYCIVGGAWYRCASLPPPTYRNSYPTSVTNSEKEPPQRRQNRQSKTTALHAHQKEIRAVVAIRMFHLRTCEPVKEKGFHPDFIPLTFKLRQLH